MRRSICFCEPKRTIAGKVNTWKFVYTTDVDLPKGTNLKFDLQSQGRPFDWQLPQVNPKIKENLIWAEQSNKKALKATEVLCKKTERIQYEFTLPLPMKAGEFVTIFIGTPSKNIEKNGNSCQKFIQRRKSFHLYVDPKGKKSYNDPETFYIDIKGDVLSNIRIIAPSVVTRNKRFDVIVRFEDQYGNLTSNAPEKTLINLSHEHIRENLCWQLFVPETGFISLPNLYFNEPGIYQIKLQNLQNNTTFFSPPIKCFADYDKSLFWGLFHGESSRFDASENIENCLRYFRDEQALQFYGSSPFESEEETPQDIYKSISQHVAEFNEEDRFVTFLGFQWQGVPKEEGLRQFIYLKDAKPIFRKKDMKYNCLKKIYKSIQPKDMISIPCFTMGEDTAFDFTDFNPQFEKVVEIYNAWGSSECTEKENNPLPITTTKKKKSPVFADGSIINALKKNCRFGFVAGGLDDRGAYSSFFHSDQEQYSPGLTGIYAQTQGRDSLAQAIMKRQCYATTGEKIIVCFNIAGQPMGSELNSFDKPGLEWNRYISGSAIGTKKLETVTIFRNGTPIKTFEPEGFSLDFEFDDTEKLLDVVIKPKDSSPPFVFYYLRVVQEDGHIAWSSPIWADYINDKLQLAKKAKTPTKQKK